MKRSGLLFNGLLWFLLTFPAYAGKVDDIRIVIDISGSMQKTDPNNLRVPALRMLNGLIPSGAKAGVWTFGKYVNMEVKWGSVNAEWRKQADLGARKINSLGQFTNIESALKRSTSGWGKADPKTRRILVFLTDGKVDISKDPAKNALSRSNVLTKSIPDLINKGVKVYTIALSDQTDEVLLKRLALKTQGSFEVAHSAEDLQRIFLRMFERATLPDTVPLNDNKFTIDNSIREMTLLVFRKGAKKTGLIQPDGTKYSEARHAKNVNWRFEQGYDLITVSSPEPGTWSLDAELDPDNKVIIVTDLRLVVDELPAYITPDKTLNIQLELQDKGKIITKNSFLKFVDFSLTHNAAGNTTELPLKLKDSLDIKDKGVYQEQILAPLVEGKHEILVRADARTFTRSKRYSIEVQWPVMVEISKTQQAGVFSLNIKAREEYIKAETLRLSVKLKMPDGNLQIIQMKTGANKHSAEIKANQQDGLHQVLISLQAETIDGNTVEHKLDGYPVYGVKVVEKMEQKMGAGEIKPETSIKPLDTDPPIPAKIVNEVNNKEDSGGFTTVIFVVAANVIIILIVAGLLIYLRKKSKDNEINLFGEDEDISID